MYNGNIAIPKLVHSEYIRKFIGSCTFFRLYKTKVILSFFVFFISIFACKLKNISSYIGSNRFINFIVPTCGDLSLLDWLFFSAKSLCLSNSSALHHAIFPPLENIPFMFIIVMWHISRHLQIFHSCFLLTSTTLNCHVTYFPPSTNISFMFTIDLNDLKLSCEIPFEVILTARRLRLIVPLMFLQLCDLNLIVSQWNIVRKIFIKNMGLQVGTKSLSAQTTMYRFLEGAEMNWNVRLTPYVPIHFLTL